MRQQIIDRQISHGSPCFHRGTGLMGLENDIFKREQRLGYIGFVREYIQAGPRDALPLQGLHQGHLVNHAATRDIYQIAFWSQGRKHFGIDQIQRRLAAGTCQSQDITGFGQGGGTAMVGIGDIIPFRAVVISDGHAKRLGPFRQFHADAAQANDTEPAATRRSPRRPRSAPTAASGSATA